MLKLNHKQLNVWSASLDIIKSIYLITDSFPKNEIFGITAQVRRAAVSIISNIAEGSSRKTAKERKRYFEIARSSLVEIDSQITVAIHLNYIDKNDLIDLEENLNKLFAMLSQLIAKT